MTQMNRGKLLVEYIALEFPECDKTDELLKSVSDSLGFSVYCLAMALEDFKSEIRKLFPFCLLFGCDDG